MPTSDEQIGQNLAKIRGEMSQTDLAAAMRARGWKWSQATVWAVERGDRPLRLSEATDVVAVLNLGINALSMLTGVDEYVMLRTSMSRMFDANRDLEEAVERYRNAQLQLAAAADQAEDAGAMDGHGALACDDWLGMPVDERVRDVAAGEGPTTAEEAEAAKAHNAGTPGSSKWLNFLISVNQRMYDTVLAERESEDTDGEHQEEA